MKKTLVIHPFLFAIFPVLFLFSHNIAYLEYFQTLLPAIVTLGFTILLLLFFRLILKDNKKAGIVVSIFLILFFSYGHIFNIMQDWKVGSFVIGRDSCLLLIFCILFAYGVYFIIKTHRTLHNLTHILNAVATFLIVISLIKIGDYTYQTGASWHDNSSKESVEGTLINLEKPSKFPNIYYIILDAYARRDILKEIYSYNNAEFINYLIKKGFYVANYSSSNYCQTVLSLASSLNFTYLNDLTNRVGVESNNNKLLKNMIRDNHTFRFLKQYGYVTVAFDASTWGPVQTKNVDIYYTTPGWDMDLFYNELINTTPLSVLLKGLRELNIMQQYDFHRKKILNAFDKLEDISKQKVPIFVFAHILAPHQPFVFGEQGEAITPNRKRFTIWYTLQEGRSKEEYIESYKKQLSFINKKVQETIDKIISNSPEPPIIILQADHGPSAMLDCENPYNTNLKERMSILNAYYLPNKGHKYLYDTISPVNTFRIILNQYFGANYEILKDESYFSTWSHPYKFINVTGNINSNIDIKCRTNNILLYKKSVEKE
ncbi:MAG: hypothetical protein ABIJ37_06330 [Pseudomonadota bacterium]